MRNFGKLLVAAIKYVILESIWWLQVRIYEKLLVATNT